MPESLKYFSQYGQDRFLDAKVFKGLENGFFVDVGANDGVTYSNTYFFEKQRSWTGVCIEPHPEAYHKLTKNRRCATVNKGVSRIEGNLEFVQIDGYAEMLSGLKDRYHHDHLSRIQNEIQHHGGNQKTIMIDCQRLDTILAENGVQHVDYCSVDIEGGEMDVIETLDLRNHIVRIFTIENNYDNKNIRKYFRSFDYKLIGRLHCDEVYEKKKKIFHFLFSR